MRLENLQDQEKAIPPYTVRMGESLTFTLSGTEGDADLYTKVGAPPTTESFDCRPMQYGSNEVCKYKENRGESQVYAMIRGWSKQSPVRLKIEMTGPAKLCRQFNGGRGESFDCYEHFQCKVIGRGERNNPFKWCIIY